MIYTLFAVSSITYAMKGKKLLNNMGYFAEVEKTPQGLATGCGYSLRVRDDPNYLANLLTSNGIEIKDRRQVNRP